MRWRSRPCCITTRSSFWHVLIARDRYLAYRKARRAAARGVVVLTDRFPLPGLITMDGAVTATMLDGSPGPLARYLIERERSYYDRILPPEVLVVLRVDPEVAVRRKPEEDPAFVRRRARQVWEAPWESTGAVVVDAGRPQAEVLSEIKFLLWSRL